MCHPITAYGVIIVHVVQNTSVLFTNIVHSKSQLPAISFAILQTAVCTAEARFKISSAGKQLQQLGEVAADHIVEWWWATTCAPWQVQKVQHSD